MLKRIHLLLKMSKEEPLITIFYFFMLFFLAFLLNFTLASMEGSKYAINVLKDYRGGIIFSPFLPEDLDIGEHYDFPYFKDLVKEDDIEGFGVVSECTAEAKNHINLRCLQYSNDLLDTVDLSLSQGRWFQNENEIVLIHSANKVFGLNEKVTITYYNQPEREATIVGFLANDMIVEGNGGVTIGGYDDITYSYESLIHDAFESASDERVLNTGIREYTAIVSPSLILDSFYISGLQFIKLKPNVSKEKALLYLQEKYNEYGDFVDFDPGYESYHEEVFEMINRDEIFLLACLLILFCAGFCINNALRISKKKTEYSIYYMCGLTWSQSVIMSYIKGLLIFIVAIPMGTIYLYINIKEGTFLNLLLTQSNMFLVFGGLIMVYVLFSFPIYLKFKSQDPIELIKKDNV